MKTTEPVTPAEQANPSYVALDVDSMLVKVYVADVLLSAVFVIVTLYILYSVGIMITTFIWSAILAVAVGVFIIRSLLLKYGFISTSMQRMNTRHAA